MPLHLLHHKSYHVYNNENVERVRRDEAEARAREEAREQRHQEEDAARRLALLRGEKAPELPPSPEPETGVPRRSDGRRDRDDGKPRKRRKLRGEDDTDAEIRHARLDVEAGQQAKTTALVPRDNKSKNDAPLLDHAGHLQLIPAPAERDIRKRQKNSEHEAEKARKRKTEEDQYTMRFSNASGFQNAKGEGGVKQPWYSSAVRSAAVEAEGKDVWCNADPRRNEREQSRLAKSDPFAAMQMAQRQLKDSERDREKWRVEREREVGVSTEEARIGEREKRRKRRSGSWVSLEGFSLDGQGEKRERRRSERGGHHRREKRHRKRSWSRERSRSRDRHRSRRSHER